MRLLNFFFYCSNQICWTDYLGLTIGIHVLMQKLHSVMFVVMYCLVLHQRDCHVKVCNLRYKVLALSFSSPGW